MNIIQNKLLAFIKCLFTAEILTKINNANIVYLETNIKIVFTWFHNFRNKSARMFIQSDILWNCRRLLQHLYLQLYVRLVGNIVLSITIILKLSCLVEYYVNILFGWTILMKSLNIECTIDSQSGYRETSLYFH